MKGIDKMLDAVVFFIILTVILLTIGLALLAARLFWIGCIKAARTMVAPFVDAKKADAITDAALSLVR